jgi:hypothetical protein
MNVLTKNRKIKNEIMFHLTPRKRRTSYTQKYKKEKKKKNEGLK